MLRPEIVTMKNGIYTLIRESAERLRGVEWTRRGCSLGLSPPDARHHIQFQAFGKNLVLSAATLELVSREADTVLDDRERLLVYRYLSYDGLLTPDTDFISIRQFPGGMFYWNPFLNRTSIPLAGYFHNDIVRLRTRIDRFAWDDFHAGDIGARISIIGHVFLALIYRRGDEEFPPRADILFNRATLKTYTTEEAVVLAGQVCKQLLRE